MSSGSDISRRNHGSAGSGTEPRPLRADELSSADLRQTIGEILRVLMLRRWVFFVPFCLAAAGAFIASQYIPRTYEARARFEQRTDPVSVNLPPQIMTSTFGFFLNTLEQDIKGDEVMVPVVEQLGLTDALDKLPDGTLTEQGRKRCEAIGRRLASNVEVAAWSQSEFHNIIDLRYTGSDSDTMVRVLNLVKDEYIRLIRRRVTDKLVETRDWYAEQAGLQRQAIEEIDHRLTAMRLEYPGVDPTNPGSVAFQVDVAERELASLKREQSRLDSRIESRRRFLAAAKGQDTGSRSIVLSNPQAQRLRETLENSEQRIAELKSTRGMTELHPDIVAERKLQARLQERLANLPATASLESSPVSQTVAAIEEFVADPITNMIEATSAWSPEVADAELDLKSLLQQHAELQEDIEVAGQRHERLVSVQGNVFATRNEFTRIQDELNRARDDFGTFQGLVDQCDRGLTVENEERGIRFADVLPPGGSTVPVSPQTKTVLILSILAGMACGLVCVVMAELFDHRFRTSAQVAKALGIPVLERIDEIVTSAVRRRRLLQRAVVVPAVSVALLSVTGLSGALAYLSLNRPNTYERLMRLPRSAWSSLSGSESTAEASGSAGNPDKTSREQGSASAKGEDRWDG